MEETLAKRLGSESNEINSAGPGTVRKDRLLALGVGDVHGSLTVSQAHRDRHQEEEIARAKAGRWEGPCEAEKSS